MTTKKCQSLKPTTKFDNSNVVCHCLVVEVDQVCFEHPRDMRSTHFMTVILLCVATVVFSGQLPLYDPLVYEVATSSGGTVDMVTTCCNGTDVNGDMIYDDLCFDVCDTMTDGLSDCLSSTLRRRGTSCGGRRPIAECTGVFLCDGFGACMEYRINMDVTTLQTDLKYLYVAAWVCGFILVCFSMCLFAHLAVCWKNSQKDAHTRE